MPGPCCSLQLDHELLGSPGHSLNIVSLESSLGSTLTPCRCSVNICWMNVSNPPPPSEILQWESQPSRRVTDFHSHAPAFPVGSLPVTPFKIMPINIHICTDDPEMSSTISRESQSVYFIAAVLLPPRFGLGDGTNPRDLIPVSAIVFPFKSILLKSGECKAVLQIWEPNVS